MNLSSFLSDGFCSGQMHSQAITLNMQMSYTNMKCFEEKTLVSILSAIKKSHH